MTNFVDKAQSILIENETEPFQKLDNLLTFEKTTYSIDFNYIDEKLYMRVFTVYGGLRSLASDMDKLEKMIKEKESYLMRILGVSDE